MAQFNLKDINREEKRNKQLDNQNLKSRLKMQSRKLQ